MKQKVEILEVWHVS